MAKSYLDKYKGVDRPSVYDILQKVGTTEYRNGTKKEYEAVDISKVKIDEITLTNYGAYSFVREKTFVKSPERSSDGSLGNLNSHATFLTPHLILDFSVMSIEDYRAIMQLHYARNEYTVECYDPIYDKKIVVKMYFATEEMAKLYTIAQNRFKPDGEWEEWVDLVGVTEYKVELIGTNNDIDLVSVRYVYNSDITPTGSPIPDQFEEDVYVGEEIIVGQNSTFQAIPPTKKKKFKGWNTASDGSGTPYGNGKILTINGETTLYAIWEDTTGYKLSFNYGLSKPYLTGYDPNTGVPMYQYDKSVTYQTKVGTLPPITAEPKVEYEGIEYPAYENGGWYKRPTKDPELKVTEDTLYWTERDDIIYCLYDAKKFAVTFVTNDPNPTNGALNIPTTSIAYGDRIYQPELYREGYKFDGWYTDEALTKKLPSNSTMPPVSFTIYAKWSTK